MNQTVKKILIWIASIIGIGIIGCIGFAGSVFYSFISGCGMDDGPFEAVRTNPIEISESSLTFNLSNNGKLILDNRTDTLSPVLTLIENGKIKWTLDTDVRNTEGYETCRIWEITNLTVRKDSNPIKLSFTGHWTYGVEAGTMKIDRDDGENSFCLSW
jgi:hypothetical protein